MLRECSFKNRSKDSELTNSSFLTECSSLHAYGLWYPPLRHTIEHSALYYHFCAVCVEAPRPEPFAALALALSTHARKKGNRKGGPVCRPDTTPRGSISY